MHFEKRLLAEPVDHGPAPYLKGSNIIGDHDLVMMTFQVRLKMARQPNQPRLRFDLEKLRNPDVVCTFQATIGGKFAPLVGLSDEDRDMDTMITTYNTAVTDAACEILGKERRRKKPWVTKDVLDLCDERRNLKKKQYEAEGAKEYREANRRVQKAVKKAKEDWIGAQCEDLPEQKQQQESISAGEGSNLRETG